MKKLLAFILICSSLLFAKEYKTYTYAYVTHSEPVYEHRYDRVYEECDEDEYYYESTYDEPRYDRRNDIGLDTIVGATIGVAIGNQIGRGNGRTVAKIAGGLLGASIANNNRHQENYAKHQPRYKKRYNECNNRAYTKRKSRVLVGYKNYFRYKNSEHYKITKRAKNRIKITHTISY